jgi:hypothetical protein
MMMIGEKARTKERELRKSISRILDNIKVEFRKIF